MASFIGQYEAKVDDKGRLVFPAAFKALLPEGELPRLVIKKNIFEDCLEMYTGKEWERQSEELKSKLKFLNKDNPAFWRKYMRDCAEVILDARIGRFAVPRNLLEKIGVTKEVVFSGNDYKIELWAKEKFADSEISDEVYLKIAGALSNLG